MKPTPLEMLAMNGDLTAEEYLAALPPVRARTDELKAKMSERSRVMWIRRRAKKARSTRNESGGQS